MNLQNEISPELWDAVSKSYGAAHYSNAITDAIRCLFDVIREKAGVELDGAQLIGQALQGDNPILQLNKLQTQSDKDEQKGFQEILRGIYSGIRNPRSHERLTDTQETADAIIVFVNYLLNVINQAKEPFTVEGWIERVYDPYFVQTKEYAEALVEEIPPRKRFETFISFYHKRQIYNIVASKYIFPALYAICNEAQIKEFLRVVSSELKVIQDRDDIKFHFKFLRPTFWPDIDRVAKLRIEGIILKEIQEGLYELQEFYSSSGFVDVDYGFTAGDLGTCAVSYIPYFLNRQAIVTMLYRKLRSPYAGHQNYVTEYFLLALPTLVDNDKIHHFTSRICEILIETEGESLLAKNIAECFHKLPAIWREPIDEMLKKNNEEIYKKVFVEDIPF